MLATGGIEAVLTSADGGSSAKFWDHVQNFSAINFAWALSMLTVNKDAFDKLSEKNKKAVRDAAAEAEARRWAALDENVQSRYAEMRAKNVKVVPAISAETRASMVKASEPAVNDWLAKIGPDGKTIIDSFRNRSKK
jgi:TRAP-type C4-dicarboxylate transport system substrate-binding protein